MILVLYISSQNSASWLVYQRGLLRYQKKFSFAGGEDKSLQQLDAFFRRHNIKFSQLRGLILLVQDASLTQVKIFSTMINTIGWQFDLPAVGRFYFSQPWEKALSAGLARLKKIRHFQPLKIKYKYKPDIIIKINPRFINKSAK